MSAGLFGLLDDVAAIARMAAASVDDIGAAAGSPAPSVPTSSCRPRSGDRPQRGGRPGLPAAAHHSRRRRRGAHADHIHVIANPILMPVLKISGLTDVASVESAGPAEA